MEEKKLQKLKSIAGGRKKIKKPSENKT